MGKTHNYALEAVWEGNTGTGTSGVMNYDRSHTIRVAGKPELHLTTDNALVGDKNKLNPEDLLLCAVSSCHMLSYLYVCALEGVVVTAYSDKAVGTMIEKEEGGGSFSEITLKPVVKVAKPEMVQKAIELHHKAHELCYIANSLNFEVKCHPICEH